MGCRGGGAKTFCPSTPLDIVFPVNKGKGKDFYFPKYTSCCAFVFVFPRPRYFCCVAILNKISDSGDLVPLTISKLKYSPKNRTPLRESQILQEKKQKIKQTLDEIKIFLVACTRLYNPLCPSVGRLVHHTLLFFMILFL